MDAEYDSYDSYGKNLRNVTKGVTKDITKELSERQRFILELIRDKGTTTIPEMSQKTNETKRTIKFQSDFDYWYANNLLDSDKEEKTSVQTIKLSKRNKSYQFVTF